MRYNVDFATDKLAMAAQALGVNTAGMDPRTAALAAADAVEGLMREMGHPMKLIDVGVPADALDVAAFHAICDTTTIFNARPVLDPNEVAAIYRELC